MAVIFLGAAVIVPTYLSINNSAMLVTYVRNSASEACDYLNIGVIVNESKYEPLNAIIQNYTGYNYLGFRLLGIGIVAETERNVTVQIRIGTRITESEKVKEAIGKFLMRDLTGMKGFVVRNGRLYFDGREVILEITVEKD
ncbi:hypothetical protein PYCH_10670 [Pyrococcus yayanosii CH1]|uniref:Uncharacterized protein n=2 Tax=Pyrococcus TaxID=2260 RepID=F8AER6_PYRYC|nr:hypothetical protein PYCH_10670 [Pyrococcus yayanosii CH1]